MTLTLKKRLINVGVLSAVFIVAVIIFSYVTNKGNDNMTADMGAATFPHSHFHMEIIRSIHLQAMQRGWMCLLCIIPSLR